MNKDLENYYNARFDLFSSQGWADLTEDLQGMVDSYSDISKINSIEDLYVRKGQLDILNWLLSLKEISEQAYEELNAEDI